MPQKHESSVTTTGRVLHGALGYDLLVWVMTAGRPRRLRRRFLDLAGVTAGERVLDIGCGTGDLAIEAKARIGPSGVAAAIDPSPEMIARAQRKARRATTVVHFQQAAAEGLPFSDAQFDVVTSTLMLHHLPRNVRELSLRETARVLKPSGRVLAVDFGRASGQHRGILSHLHRRHGRTTLEDLVAVVQRAQLEVVQSGPVGLRDLNFVLATKPLATHS